MTTLTRTLVYDDAPKSLNAGGTGSRRHWSKGYREKKEWQGIWGMLLLAEKLPRGATHVRIHVRIDFDDSRRRDSENFRPAVSKPFADALVAGGWLADDTDEFFTLVECKVNNEVSLDRGMATNRREVVGRTTVIVEADYETQDVS